MFLGMKREGMLQQQQPGGPCYTSTQFLGFRNKQAVFQTIQLFPGFSLGCAGPSPYPVTFLNPLGFHTFMLSNPLSKIYQASLLPFMVTSLAPTGHASNFIILHCACSQQKDLLLCYLGFYLHVYSKGISPLLFNLLPYNPG